MTKKYQTEAIDTTTVTASKWAICLESAVGIHGLQELLTRLAVPNAQIAKFNRGCPGSRGT